MVTYRPRWGKFVYIVYADDPDEARRIAAGDGEVDYERLFASKVIKTKGIVYQDTVEY